jgi:large subunit ribosomal protein L9
VKVVLRQDVEKLGERGQIVNVAPGFARNFLVPKGLAMEATPGNLRTIALQKKVWGAREAKEAEQARGFAAQLAGVRLTIPKKSGENDTLYGSVTNTEIAELLAAKGFAIDRRKILLPDSIKTLGTYTVPIKIHTQVVAEVTVQVTAEVE